MLNIVRTSHTINPTTEQSYKKQKRSIKPTFVADFHLSKEIINCPGKPLNNIAWEILQITKI